MAALLSSTIVKGISFLNQLHREDDGSTQICMLHGPWPDILIQHYISVIPMTDYSGQPKVHHINIADD